MGDRDLPSDSDSSDEDYVPQGAENEPVSEDESAHDSNEQEPSEGENVGEEKKRKKAPSRKRPRKKLKSQKDEEPKKEEKPEMSAEHRKQKADALWADFLKDCDPPVRRKSDSSQNSAGKNEKVADNPSKVKMVEEYHFAGEKVLVEKEMAATKNPNTVVTTNGATNPNSAHPSTPAPTRGRGRGRGGIASVLGQIGKKNKLSTLEKSKLDWNTFKKDEGIEEDIERYNKGKNGYLERQDFLERSDLRQFEIEKSLRASKRSSLR